MMEMYRERVVKNPQKRYNCDLCSRPIIGKHKYISGVCDGIFYTMRVHCGCNADMHDMCNDCEYNGDCQLSAEECFSRLEREIVG